MKKIISLLLSVLLVFSAVFMVSCDDEKISKESHEAYKSYTDALDKINALDSINGKLNMSMTMKIDDTVESMAYNFNMKATGVKSPETMKMRMDGTMNMMGQSIVMDAYIDSGWAYYDMTSMGTNMQFKTNLNGENEEYSQMFEIGKVELPEKLFKKVVIENNADDSMSLSLTLSGSQLLDLYPDLSSSGIEAAKPSDISDANVSATVDKNGYLTKIEMSFSIDVEGVKASTAITVEYIDPGKSVTVAPMEGYESFPEQSIG